ncbi:hypothetical protein CC78DRAFT_581901 [Lojkania enalia]|uniref:Uncharacterized protein n=1 Tax=Lojkania enalia TaxID=147567 RepID=A0A9P4KAJ2_9PLEO|nr:hypothetical protein CC78DRAFT_581901 [Didymosphaeria enalia]
MRFTLVLGLLAVAVCFQRIVPASKQFISNASTSEPEIFQLSPTASISETGILKLCPTASVSKKADLQPSLTVHTTDHSSPTLVKRQATDPINYYVDPKIAYPKVKVTWPPIWDTNTPFTPPATTTTMTVIMPAPKHDPLDHKHLYHLHSPHIFRALNGTFLTICTITSHGYTTCSGTYPTSQLATFRINNRRWEKCLRRNEPRCFQGCSGLLRSCHFSWYDRRPKIMVWQNMRRRASGVACMAPDTTEPDIICWVTPDIPYPRYFYYERRGEFMEHYGLWVSEEDLDGVPKKVTPGITGPGGSGLGGGGLGNGLEGAPGDKRSNSLNKGPKSTTPRVNDMEELGFGDGGTKNSTLGLNASSMPLSNVQLLATPDFSDRETYSLLRLVCKSLLL